MTVLLLASLSAGQWRPTSDHNTGPPASLPAAQRKPLLNKLNPLLSILKTALNIDNAEAQATLNFEGNPMFPGLPWPRSVGLYVYELTQSGGTEGEASTIIHAFVNDFDPILHPITVDKDECFYTLIAAPRITNRGNTNFNGILLVTKPGKRLFRPVSRREYAQRMKIHYERRMARFPKASEELQKMNTDIAALSTEEREMPMLLQSQRPYMRDEYGPIPWPGFGGNTNPVVAIDMSYFDSSKRDALQFVLLLTNSYPRERPDSVERVKKFYRKINYEAMRELFK